ncbi:MAG: hypothetical protein GXP09_05695 [Gammaproteobacteria bacterium]|nr:hypothetical protein [Gammaproteobacteria bacterium]
MMRKIIHSVLFAALVMVFVAPQVMAEWVVKEVPMVGWVVTNGDKTVRAGSKKEAKKKAKILNKDAAEFKSDGSGPCDDPNSGVRC